MTVSAMVIAASEALMPDGAVKKVGKLTGGLILMLGILQPLVTMDYEELYDTINTLPAGALIQEKIETQVHDPLKGIIEQELATYIVDKAEELGAECSAVIVCQTGEVPTPERVTITGLLTGEQKRALSQYVTEELGVGPENQIYWNEALP